MENASLIKKEKGKTRNPNIELVRILGMFIIVIHHLLVHGKALLKYRKYYQIQSLFIICMWHVNSFGIISGIVGNTTHKFSNLFNLWIITIFYLLLFYIIYNRQYTLLKNNYFITNIFPVIYLKYWYFTAYFGIYPFLPFINSGISILPRIVSKKIVYFMIGIFIIWTSYNKDVFGMFSG